MKIYIVTNEPYRDNSTIVGVELDRELAISAAQMFASEEKNIAIDDSWYVTEWDVETKTGRVICRFVRDIEVYDWYDMDKGTQVAFDGAGVLLKFEE